MLRTALGGMYLGNFVLFFLEIDLFGAGAVLAMNTLEKTPTKLISEVLLSDPPRLWLPRSHSPLKHIEILEVRGIFKNIVKCQQKKPDEDVLKILDDRKKKPISLNKSRKIHYIGQKKLAGGRQNKMIIANRKSKNPIRKKIPNNHLMKRNSKKFVERHFKKARRSKRPNKLLHSQSHRKPKVMMKQKEDEFYSEVKRKSPKSKRIELFTRPGRNKNQVRKRKVLKRRANSFSKALEIKGLLISVSPTGERHQELIYSADGDASYEEATTIKNEWRGLHTYANSNAKGQSKENVDAFSTVVTTTFDGLKGSDHLTYSTTTRTEILSHQQRVKSKELHTSNNESESSESYFKATTVMPMMLLTNSENEIMSNKVSLYKNGIRGDDNILETATSRQMTPSWNNRVLESLPMSKPVSSDSWKKIHLELQTEEIGSSIVGDQIILLPHNSVSQVESSGDSERPVELVHENRTLQVTETIHVQSTDRALPYPTSKKDENVTSTVVNGIVEIQDSVFSPLEMVMNLGSETTYCKPGYKYYNSACKSMCDMGDFYCANGGQCVIVENLGAMCRCHQTNNLCYRGECCRLSLTLFQLICVIGSCCIFVSVFLGSISLLIRRMDIKAVSKSVRTRLWISTLMPESRSSSFSHSVASEITACSEYDSPDMSSFNHKKEVTYEDGTLKCERTRL
ncbi:uncharacterized protein ACMZJ9_017633 [Mantella aurantiaca]